MKAPKEHQVRVGLFITIGITILCLSIFFLGGNQIIKSQVYFKARFPQSQGLQNGSVVSFTGIIIGNIVAINLLPGENTVEITFKVDANFASRFTEGTEIDIRTQGALGDKYVFVKPGAPHGKIYPENAVLPVMKATDFVAMFNEKGDQAAKIFDILNDLHQLTQSLVSDNQIGKLLANTDSTMTQLRHTLTEGERLVKEFRSGAGPNESSKISKSIDKLDHILTRLDKGEGTLGALLTDSSIHDRLKSMLGTDNKTNNLRSIMRTSIEHQEKN
jgi:phospholipid/cholesterol/gamma-HCH transport system substrate-binding protein